MQNKLGINLDSLLLYNGEDEEARQERREASVAYKSNQDSFLYRCVWNQIAAQIF